MGRIEEIVSRLDKCDSFADVGCDHGLCTYLALKRGICQKAYISDVSQKCLAKAEKLLRGYICAGQCVPVCCNGLEKIPKDCGQVLIAGMGGMEIINILSTGFIPEKFVLQPMKNAEKLRAFLIERGCKITLDDVFYDEKYYFIIKGLSHGGTAPYSERELAFGRDSLGGEIIKGYALEEARKLRNAAAVCGSGISASVAKKIKFLEEILK